MSLAESTMTREVIYVTPELSLAHAWGLLQRHRIRHLPVMSRGTLRGILSDRDVLLHAKATPTGSIVVPDMPVALAMTADPITCELATPIADIARTMIDRKIGSVLVVDGSGALVGLVTSTDLLSLMLDGNLQRPLPYAFDLHEATL